MSDIGPQLPPHLLAKRKRQREEEAQNEEAAASGAKAPSSPEDGEKRRRIAGPAMPPAPLDERPREPSNGKKEDSSDDDDDFGPAPPSAEDAGTASKQHEDSEITAQSTAPETLKRDEWMMMPPKQDDLAARMDPLKQRPRGFNTGKGAKGPSASGDDNSSWHETPEQKRKRLEDEMMGISKPSPKGSVPTSKADHDNDAAAAAKIREHTEKTRGPSLMEQHQNSNGAIEEDDPSKRAFDREKDMKGGMNIGHTQRKQMLNKASGFSSKFSGGSYL